MKSLKLVFGIGFLISLVAYGDYELDLDSSNTNYWDGTPSITRPAKPGYQSSYVGDVHGTRVTRISGDLGVAIPNASGTWGDVHKHGYSKRSAFNCDGTIIQLEKGGRIFVDGKTYTVKYKKGAPKPNTRWHPTKPTVQFYIDGRGEVGEWDVEADTTIALFTIAGYSGYNISGKGNWSDDGSSVAVKAIRNSDSKTVFFRINMNDQTKEADIVVSDIPNDDNYIVLGSTNYWTISPLNTYLFVIGNFGDGGADRIKVWNAVSGTLVDHETGKGLPSHCDLTIDANGDEIAVGVAKSDSGTISKWTTIKRRLSDGQLTEILANSGSHYSTRNVKRPGWVYMSVQSKAAMYNGSNNPYTGEIVAIKLDGSGHERLGIMHGGDKDEYDQEHHACTSADGTRVIFGSDWGVDKADSSWQVQAYVADASEYVLPTVQYKLNETNCAGFVDARNNADDGTFVGSISCTGSAIYLNSDEYGKVVKDNIEAFMPENDFSISMWVDISGAIPTPSGDRYLLNYSSAYSLKYNYTDETDNSLKFVIDTTDDGGNYKTLSINDVLNDASNQHIVATYDGQVMKLYVNGVLEGDLSQNGKIDNPNKDLYLGGNSASGKSHYGFLDDVRLYDVSLSQDAIDAIYADGAE